MSCLEVYENVVHFVPNYEHELQDIKTSSI